MDADDAKKAQLIEAVVETDRIKAAGLIGKQGNLRRIHGHAKVFRNGEPVGAEESSQEGHEDAYLEAIGDEYLVVVFETDQDFEPIKAYVDELLQQLDL